MPPAHEEGAQGRAVVAGIAAAQPAAVVVDHDSEVLVGALVGDLIVPDPALIGERFDRGQGWAQPVAVRSDCSPGGPHQLGDRCLGALRSQPGHLLVERAGVPGAVSSPGHLAHRRPVDGAIHPLRLGLARRAGWFPCRARATAAAPQDALPGSPRIRMFRIPPDWLVGAATWATRTCASSSNSRSSTTVFVDAQHSAP